MIVLLLFLAIAIYWRVLLVCGFCMVLGVVCHRLNFTFIYSAEETFWLLTTCFYFYRNVLWLPMKGTISFCFVVYWFEELAA